ncbi:MAG: dTDP-4-dehydrorhamnose reductase, partial [Candidatus Omnitrophica bacterium CG10_big_fil_rev_8_21_14_0_10_43_8]
PTYVDDLAKAVIKLVSLKKEGIYHVANSGVCSWYEFAEKILKISGIKKEVIPIKTDKSARAARRPKMSALCCDKYVEAAGKPMRHGREALKDYLKEIC